MTGHNPYSAPTSRSATKPNQTGNKAERIRKKYLSHEASIQSFGLLYYLGGFFGILGGVSVLVLGLASDSSGGMNPNQEDIPKAFMLVLGVVYLAMGIGQLFTAYGLRRLTAPGRIGGTIFGAIGLLAIPIGTLISGYLLYLLWSEKGNAVFSPKYQKVIKATPHIKYKTSIIVWIFLALLLVLIGFGVIGLLMG